MKSSMAAAVKRITAPAHRDAEEAVRAFDPFASRARYAAYLARLHGFYAALETQIECAPERRKLPLIGRDLTALGVAPVVARAPRIRTRATAMGVSYVLEGKTLGARFLLDEVHTTFGADVPCDFFAGYGDRTGAMWNAFRAELEAFVREEGRRTAILDGALTTFAFFMDTIGHGDCSTPRHGSKEESSIEEEVRQGREQEGRRRDAPQEEGHPSLGSRRQRRQGEVAQASDRDRAVGSS